MGRKEVERRLRYNNTQTQTNREGKNNFTPSDTHSEILLRSLKEHNFYTGYTNNLKKRIEENNDGEVESTKNRTTLQLVHSESCLCQRDAATSEKVK